MLSSPAAALRKPPPIAAHSGSPMVDWPRLSRQFTDYLVSECGVTQNTVDAYCRDLREFVSSLDSRDIATPSQITPTIVREHLVRLNERGLALSSIARHLVSIKMFLRYLHIVGITAENIGSLLETPRKWRTLPHTLRQGQVEGLLSAPQPGDPFYARDRAILEMLYATGMRVSELAGLRLQDVNLAVGYVRVFGKGNRERIVPIGSHAIDAASEYIRSLRAVLTESAGP
ncbi:MAG TPA: tyrosine-type recombinase/integrase, partial [Phycisphaerae bacterium]|nr:tyrosine-type recombinase/integrase [Phycisphaerae bacterium]